MHALSWHAEPSRIGMRRRVLRTAGIPLAALALITPAVPAGALDAGPGADPGLPATISVVGGAVDGQVFTGARLWDEHVNWCDLQPRADSDVQANLQGLLAPRIDALVAAGARRVMIPLGHPAPWVFGDHPRARALATRWDKGRAIWFCDGRASAISLPAPATLRPDAQGHLSPQQARFSGYAATVIDFLAERYGARVQVDLQVMNEPNLLNGLDLSLRIPGAASTTTQAVASLVAYEALVRTALDAHPDLPYRLVSSSLYQRTNTFLRGYLAAQNRTPTIDALAFNIYSRKRTPDAMVADWDRKASRLVRLVGRYSRLRHLPRLVTETNHNLNNHKPTDRSNSTKAVAAAPAQARLATATQLNALFRGFDEVYWLIAAPNQAAVVLALGAGNPARDALAGLSTAIGGRFLVGCRAVGRIRSCTFRDPGALQPDARVVWRQSGRSLLRLGSMTRTISVAGTMGTMPAGSRIWIGTTPTVLLDEYA